MSLEGKTVYIFIEDLFDDMEAMYPYYRFQEAGAKVVVWGSGEKDEFKSKRGLPFKADGDVKDANGADCDALIVPGGYAPDRMRRYPHFVRVAREAGESGKVIASICHGPWLLISAGLVKGKTVSGFFAIKDDLVNAGATVVDQEVAVDGNLITSRTPKDLPAFCKTIIAKMEG